MQPEWMISNTHLSVIALQLWTKGARWQLWGEGSSRKLHQQGYTVLEHPVKSNSWLVGEVEWLQLRWRMCAAGSLYSLLFPRQFVRELVVEQLRESSWLIFLFVVFSLWSRDINVQGVEDCPGVF